MRWLRLGLRLRLRTLMILVALFGVCLGGVELWRRSASYSRKARMAEDAWGALEAEMEGVLEARDSGDEELSRVLLAGHNYIGQGEPAEGIAALAQFYRRRVDHYAALKDKYRRAAQRPWLSVPPDPPVPPLPAGFVLR